jgi:hypothetical protein
MVPGIGCGSRCRMRADTYLGRGLSRCRAGGRWCEDRPMSESAARVAVIVAVTLTLALEAATVALTVGVGALDQALI